MTAFDKSIAWYIAGPMTGIPQFNFPLFDSVAADLRAQGVAVLTPSELDAPEVRELALASVDGDPTKMADQSGTTWGDMLARDVKVVADKVDGVLLLHGWQKSRGARLEAFVGLLTGKRFAVLKQKGAYRMATDGVYEKDTYVQVYEDYVRCTLERNMP